ncbi:MAG: hypothetical protein CML68_13140 [Rhodobacteraceae bacterium]|nr:hypothetical protein [Paracoccaceae bacterium]
MSQDQLCAIESRLEELETRLNHPRMMTPLQVCDFLQISERALYDMKERGDAPPAIYFSQRTVRYDLHEVIAWAKQKEVGQG